MKDEESPRPAGAVDSAAASPDVKQLRREAEDARAELADSLHELRTRLSPAEMLAQTKSSVQVLTEHATASVAAQVKRSAEDFRQQVALRSQQAVQAVQDWPAAVAATTAAAAGLFWFLSRDRDRNGHRAAGNGRLSANSGSSKGSGRPPSTAGEAPGHLPTSARPPAAFDPAASTLRYEDGVVDDQQLKGPKVGGRWSYLRPGRWTTGAAAAIVTSAVLARRTSSNQARQSGAHAQAHWQRAQDAARRTSEQASDRARDVTHRVRVAVERIARGPSGLQAGPAAAVGAAIGIAAALLLPRTPREMQVSRQLQESMRRSVSSATRRLADEARRSLLPTVAALLNTSSTRTRGQ